MYTTGLTSTVYMGLQKTAYLPILDERAKAAWCSPKVITMASIWFDINKSMQTSSLSFHLPMQSGISTNVVMNVPDTDWSLALGQAIVKQGANRVSTGNSPARRS